MLPCTPKIKDMRLLLENFDLQISLNSPSEEYRLEYSTVSDKDRVTGETRLTRTYRLIDLVRGGVTSEPWDRYDQDKQASMVANLVNFSGYRVSKVVSGWKATCPGCGHIMVGKIWELPPKTCKAKSPRKCRAAIDGTNVEEILSAGEAP